MEKHFTSTVYIIENQKVLLIFHPKFQKWLPPGGHLESNETPPEGARREVLEETGLEIDFTLQENVWINRWNANSIERPFLCLLEEIPECNGNPAHQHIDFVFVAKPRGMARSVDNTRWFCLDEIRNLKGDQDIFVETQMILEKILSEDFCGTKI